MVEFTWRFLHDIIQLHNNVLCATDNILQNIPSFKLNERNILHNTVSPT